VGAGHSAVAGEGHGAQFLPREGMEVLVGFLEHQDNRPVILDVSTVRRMACRFRKISNIKR